MITLTMGCMRSGKSTLMEEHIREVVLTNTSIEKLFCYSDTKNIMEWLIHTAQKKGAIFIDEAQFIEWDLEQVCYLKTLSETKGIQIYLYGLDKWHDTTETSLSKFMKYHADSVRYLRARCDMCGEPATLTAKVKGDRTEQVNEDKGLYSPVCEKCYDKICKGALDECSCMGGYGY